MLLSAHHNHFLRRNEMETVAHDGRARRPYPTRPVFWRLKWRARCCPVDGRGILHKLSQGSPLRKRGARGTRDRNQPRHLNRRMFNFLYSYRSRRLNGIIVRGEASTAGRLCFVNSASFSCNATSTSKFAFNVQQFPSSPSIAIIVISRHRIKTHQSVLL